MKRRAVMIDGYAYDVMDEGDRFIETVQKRYSWREGELKSCRWETRPVTPYIDPEDKSGKSRVTGHVDEFITEHTGRDIVEISGPDYDKGRGYECFIRFAGSEQRIRVPAPKVENAPQRVSTPLIDPMMKAVHAAKVAAEKAQSAAEETKAQTAPKSQVKNVKHGLRLDRTERDKAKKKPGGQPKGEDRAMKDAMRSIQSKLETFIKAGKKPPGITKLAGDVKQEKNLDWEVGHLRNKFSRWDSKKDTFRK